MGLSKKTIVALSAIALATAGSAYTVSQKSLNDKTDRSAETHSQPKSAIEFTFTAFGDAGWADTHTRQAKYKGGFKRAFLRFNNKQETLGDINYINWETSIGTQCDQFWSKQSPSTFAFLTHPKELEDAIDLGFNMIGLANNHTFDCLRSTEGNGPIQSYRFTKELAHKKPGTTFSGVFAQSNQEPAQATLSLPQGDVPVTFLSAYVGGNQSHCANMSCAINLAKSQSAFTDKKRLRVLALHSWDKNSHNQLKSLLRKWINLNLVDVAIGSGPHIAESVEIINTQYGKKILATSLGNFIHPSLSPQPYNIVLQTKWTIDPQNQEPRLITAKAIKASCDGGTCTNVGSINLD